MAKKNDTKAKVNDTKAKVEVVEELTSTENFIDKYKKPLIIGGASIVVIILAIIGYQKLVSEPNELESQEAYWPAFYEVENDSLEMAINGTDKFVGMADIADEYAGTSGGNIANYTLGLAEMEKGAYQNAIDYFDECSFEDVMVATLVIGLKGDCYVELDDYDNAISMFDEASTREPNDFTTPMFLKKLGLTYEAQGNRASALTAYQSIKDNWSTSEEAFDIEKYIGRVQN